MNKKVNTWLMLFRAQGPIITPLRSACFSPARVPLSLMDCHTETREETIASSIFFLSFPAGSVASLSTRRLPIKESSSI